MEQPDEAQTPGNGIYSLQPMRVEDIADVSRVERRCFTNPWPESAYRRELRNPASNYYVVLRWRQSVESAEPEIVDQRGRLGLRELIRRPEAAGVAADPIVGFAGMWILYDEAHVTTIAVAPEHRGHGLGELLIAHFFEEGIRRKAEWLTLEVRVSNQPAQTLYEKYGFTRQGLRRRYYSDNGEDAYIMWSSSLKEPGYRRKIDELRERLIQRLAREGITLKT